MSGSVQLYMGIYELSDTLGQSKAVRRDGAWLLDASLEQQVPSDEDSAWRLHCVQIRGIQTHSISLKVICIIHSKMEDLYNWVN